MCLYYSIRDYKLDFYLRKKTTVASKDYDALVTASEKSS